MTAAPTLHRAVPHYQEIADALHAGRLDRARIERQEAEERAAAAAEARAETARERTQLPRFAVILTEAREASQRAAYPSRRSDALWWAAVIVIALIGGAVVVGVLASLLTGILDHAIGQAAFDAVAAQNAAGW